MIKIELLVANPEIKEKQMNKLEPFCFKKSPNQEKEGFGNRGHLKVLNDTKLILDDQVLRLLL